MTDIILQILAWLGLLASAAVIAVLLWATEQIYIGAGEPDVNGDPERDAGTNHDPES